MIADGIIGKANDEKGQRFLDTMPTKTTGPRTPGPWKVRYEKSRDRFVLSGTHDNIGDFGCFKGYEVDGVTGEGEDAANARLIAAVPCLLEALIKMIDHAQEQHPHFESERGMADINRSIQAVEKGLGIKWGDVRLEQ